MLSTIGFAGPQVAELFPREPASQCSLDRLNCGFDVSAGGWDGDSGLGEGSQGKEEEQEGLGSHEPPAFSTPRRLLNLVVLAPPLGAPGGGGSCLADALPW